MIFEELAGHLRPRNSRSPGRRDRPQPEFRKRLDRDRPGLGGDPVVDRRNRPVDGRVGLSDEVGELRGGLAVEVVGLGEPLEFPEERDPGNPPFGPVGSEFPGATGPGEGLPRADSRHLPGRLERRIEPGRPLDRIATGQIFIDDRLSGVIEDQPALMERVDLPEQEIDADPLVTTLRVEPGSVRGPFIHWDRLVGTEKPPVASRVHRPIGALSRAYFPDRNIVGLPGRNRSDPPPELGRPGGCAVPAGSLQPGRERPDCAKPSFLAPMTR